MPTPNHTPRGSRTTLPPRLTVPPFPPQLYRRLLLTVEKDRVLIRPQHPTGEEEDDVRTDDSTGVLIKWGAKGKVESWDGEGKPDDEEGVVLGGILGIVRLWDGRSRIQRSILTRQLRTCLLSSDRPASLSPFFPTMSTRTDPVRLMTLVQLRPARIRSTPSRTFTQFPSYLIWQESQSGIFKS